MPPRPDGAPAGSASGPAGEAVAGFFYALGAYSLWGIAAAYFKLVAHLPLAEVIAHRIVWSLLLVGIVLAVTGSLATVVHALATPRNRAILTATSLLILINWSTYFWAVSTDRILDVSLGYYINPLMSVVLGVVILGEKLTRRQSIAVALAALAVAVLTVAHGTLPWLALTLAASFAAYGYLRKSADVGAAAGVFVEAAILAPLAVGVLVWLEVDGGASITSGGLDLAWLALTGAWTAVPLMLFAAGARRLTLSTLGLMQYAAPSIQFVLAVAVFGEVPTPAHLVAFGLIWLALALYSAETLAVRRRATLRD